MAARKLRKRERMPSSVFSMFTEEQIKEFKSAFDMIDANKDTFIDIEDLKSTYDNFGMVPEEPQLREMLGKDGKVNFKVFLAMFGEKLQRMDSDDIIRQSFETLDAEGLGLIDVETLKEYLTTMGDRLTTEECNELFDGGNYIDQKEGTFDYNIFISKMKAGAATGTETNAQSAGITE